MQIDNIKSWMFYRSDSLENVTFEEGVQIESIGDNAFADAESLKSVTFGKGVQIGSIGDGAFANSYSIETVFFEEDSQLEKIRHHAFKNTKSLTSIKIPSSVTSIDNQAFDGASVLTIYAEVAEKPTGWESVDWNWNSSNRPVHWGIQEFNSTAENIQYALLNDDTIKIAGLTSDNNSEDINMPSDIDGYTVTEIQSYAFMNHDYLNSVYIPDTITVIGENAFENYTGTINVEAESKPKNWDDNWNPENATVNWGYAPE